MCCATMKDDRHLMFEPLMDLRIWAAARFDAGDPRITAGEEIMGS
jgi:hypothetical protein